MNKPLSVKALIFISLWQIISLIIVIAFFIHFANVNPAEGSGGFRTGFLEVAGYDPNAFGGKEAAQASGEITANLIYPSLTLYFLSKKRLWWIRGISIFRFISAIGAGGLAIIPLVITVLAFLPGVARYCKS